MTAFGKQLIQAAKEVRAIASGEADPTTYRVRSPADIAARDVRAGEPPRPRSNRRRPANAH